MIYSEDSFWSEMPTGPGHLELEKLPEDAEQSMIATLRNVTSLFLVAPITDLNSFATFLRNLPNLTALRCKALPEDTITTDVTIGQEVVTLLRRFDGCIKLARLLVPGRPIQELILESHSERPRGMFFLIDVSHLRGKASSVRSLALPCSVQNMHYFQVIADTFPKLENLMVEGLHKDKVSSLS